MNDELEELSKRMDALWQLAQNRYDAKERPLRNLTCSYYVVDSGMQHNLRCWLSEQEAAELHELTNQWSCIANDPYLAHLRCLEHVKRARIKNSNNPLALRFVWLYFQL